MNSRGLSTASRREWIAYARHARWRAPAEVVRVLARARTARASRRGAPVSFPTLPEMREAARAGAHGLHPSLTLPVRAGDRPLEAIPLAAGSWPLANGAPWRGSHADPEDALAAHRFGWVPVLLATHGTSVLPTLANLACSWMEERGRDEGGVGWDAYSVSERAAALCYLLWSDPAADSVPALRLAIARHAAYLMRHLELRGSSTNNHLINNGRALYLAGAALGLDNARAAGRAIVSWARPRMFHSGFLREGSSHYQYLLLRTAAEMAVVSEAVGEREFADEMSEWAREARAAAGFLTRGGGLPLIGDACPDVRPEILLDFAGAEGGAVSPGWGTLIGAPAACVLEGRRAAEAGYYRAASAAFSVLAWVNPDGCVWPWSHAHSDLGSFVASWKGRPLLVDAGRPSYAPTAVAEYCRSVRSHNAVSVDGHEPLVAHGVNGYPELLEPSYRSVTAHGELSQRSEGATLAITHDGFARLGDGVTLRRSIRLEADGLEIVDAVTGAGRHRVETYFSFAPDVTVAQAGGGCWEIAVPGAGRLLLETHLTGTAERGVGGKHAAGWHSPAYGRIEPSVRLRFLEHTFLPARARYLFRPIEDAAAPAR